MSSTTDRDQVCAIARTNTLLALKQARKIESPWFRCQALAWVSRWAEDESLEKIAAESVRSALSASDPYQIVGACAWPVRALIERERNVRADQTLRVALSSAPHIENLVSRGKALFLLWEASSLLPAGDPTVEAVVSSLVVVCQTMPSWKGPFFLRYLVMGLACHDRAAAEIVLTTMKTGPLKRQAARYLAEGKSLPPRQFFWES